MQEEPLTAEVVKLLKDMEQKKWITINENLVVEAIATNLIEAIFNAPYKNVVRYMKGLLP